MEINRKIACNKMKKKKRKLENRLKERQCAEHRLLAQEKCKVVLKIYTNTSIQIWTHMYGFDLRQ